METNRLRQIEAVMLWLVVQGATRFAAFVRVRHELATLGPVEE
jgi:hypothetical protein